MSLPLQERLVESHPLDAASYTFLLVKKINSDGR